MAAGLHLGQAGTLSARSARGSYFKVTEDPSPCSESNALFPSQNMM